MENLLVLTSNSGTIIENNTLTEYKAPLAVYFVKERSSIQLNDAVFVRNRLMGNLLHVKPNSSVIIDNKRLTDNNASLSVY